MVTIGMNYRVIDGKQDAFIAMFNKVLSALQETPGHRESHLYVDVNDPCAFLIVSEWTERSAFDAFIRSEKFAKVATWGSQQILAERPRHTVYGDSEG